MKDFAVLIAGVQACRAVHDRILIHPCSIVNFFFLVGCREGKVLFCLFVLLLLINVLTVFYPFINIFFIIHDKGYFNHHVCVFCSFEWGGFRHRHLTAFVFVSANVVAIFISIIIMERSGDAVWTFSLQHARSVYT